MNIERLLSRAADEVSVGRAFGPPVEHDGTLVIPVAWVAGGGGGGESGEPGSDRQDVASGSGGGFGSVAWPLGVYEIRDGRVRWVPALDATRIVLAGIAILRAVLRMRKGRGRTLLSGD